ncbi:hypothetical protein [Haladaptatus sp. T7]|uniref:hypothetical protein n=1 Tax=Haladaptatus sp. T7 TaxID=2029368 RepID=UPI0021A25707|nr:hypothetical protein [Haladaptatus sp. T7]GKZ13952.1 hypothetical protein HAL_18330 [Haladaptatus sp. T7]
MTSRRVLVGTLTLGLVVGLVVGSAGSSLFESPAGARNGVEIPSESLVTATGTGCSATVDTGGWVGQQPIHDVMAVSFNDTIAHEATVIDVNATLESGADGDYFLRIETSPDPATSAKKGSPPDDCQPQTTIDAAVTVPRDYDTITVVIDGETVTTVENDGSSFARYRPVNGTA